MNQKIQGRAFIVGCNRSGTTLLQSLMAAHSQISSFPESHFYQYLFIPKRLLADCGLASKRARKQWDDFLTEIEHPEMREALPRFAISTRQYSDVFIRTLDQITLDRGKTIWVEKTPVHLHFVVKIERLVKGAKFIHILRNGFDNIASLNNLAGKYPETWGRWYSTLDICIQSWVNDARLSLNYSSKKNHRLVRYETLVTDPCLVLNDLCNFLGIPFEEIMLTDYPEAAQYVINDNEPWKASVPGPIRSEIGSRSRDQFDENVKKFILTRVPSDLQSYLSAA